MNTSVSSRKYRLTTEEAMIGSWRERVGREGERVMVGKRDEVERRIEEDRKRKREIKQRRAICRCFRKRGEREMRDREGGKG